MQGPPGTGKTYTGARVIAKLIKDGKKVGVMAHTHKSIHNLLHELEDVAQTENIAVRGFHKHSKQNKDSPYVSDQAMSLITSADDNVQAEQGDYNLISGNSWLSARPGMVDRVEYLFIDEAGQTSLADAIAVSPSAANVVLLGDPMQLAQVSQGEHADGAGESVLQYLLGERATVPENRGVLLDVSYRMHPEICGFISKSIYDDRLKPDAATANNRVASPGLLGSGLRFISIEHSGNSRESVEEAQRIVDEVGALLKGKFVRNDEPEQAITERDILIVTPYNAQRKRIADLLRVAGDLGVEVGTVDKFQGREAPVVF
jgi:superfamily I DNA and/or RNA helicase